MGYLGKERRIHRIFVTRNSEYHVRRNVCVGVRDRRSGEWLAGHLALRSTVSGGLKFHDNGAISASEGLSSGLRARSYTTTQCKHLGVGMLYPSSCRRRRRPFAWWLPS
jgi:hypothetical protein